MVQETINNSDIEELKSLPRNGRILSLDPGTKRVGAAVSDETQTIARPVRIILRKSWKNLLNEVKSLLVEFDAAALVVGLPYNFDGTESRMSAEARDMARKFGLSLTVPTFLQDERATSYEARGRIWAAGGSKNEASDSEAASIILSDFLDRMHHARNPIDLLHGNKLRP